VRFVETDAMSVVHHSSYLAYLEAARVDYLRWLGRPYTDIRADGFDIAVVSLQVAYHAPLRFDDVFRVHAGIAHRRRSTFAMEYLVERDGQTVLTGFTRHAMLDAATGRPVRLPEWLGHAT
jgi:acyl-CoA thioester hydrolase